MEPRFLLDTNICIYIREKRPEEVLRRFRKLRAGEAALSVITFGELFYGANKSAQRAAALERLRELIHVLPALPLPEAAAEAYGTIRADLEAKGAMIGNNDLWIAAHALAADLTLVSNNLREFRRVSGLRLQNWVA
ncbi:MAG TPA: type II toxin-antitoxin system VapC family toxin [Candidatus Acidoferrales bacterium]|jgi:tRNA(fMet)-specific endonuclease VapC|nr:type II toxin-antitoxin system VapC family toxin [Candidatus Acidoferrales bacterium]